MSRASGMEGRWWALDNPVSFCCANAGAYAVHLGILPVAQVSETCM